jgi:hypothetical protein
MNYLETYKNFIECHYQNEHYSVRDNGAVLRHVPEGKSQRKLDNKWTFGKQNNAGYLLIGTAVVHRIVATAFHGEPPTEKHVVDHIDSNKQNNRPENLRWLTRLENLLLNPITAKRIELNCGSINAFLENPSKYLDKFQDPQYSWMRTVTEEEALACKENLLVWAESAKLTKGGNLGEWIFSRRKKTDKERLLYEEKNASRNSILIKEIFEKVKLQTGLSQEELSIKTTKRINLKARVIAARLLRDEIGLSDLTISKLIGVSKSMVNTYLNHTSTYLK